MIKLFEVDEKYMVQLNKVWISMFPEFKRILNRDRGSEGDSHGRYKKQATAEFTYIYLMFDYHSPFENYNQAQREGQTEMITGICPHDVEKDEELMLAIERYKDLLANSSPTLRGLRSLKGSIDEMWNFFDQVDYTKISEHGKPIFTIKEVQDSMVKMPDTMKSIKKLEDQVKDELAGESGLRGDAEKGVEEDPDFE